MVTKFDKLFSEFLGLNHDEKKQKVLAMLDYIKDKMDMAQAISTFIQNTPNITDDFLEKNYSMIMNVALESNEQKITADAQQKLEKIASIQKVTSEKKNKDQEEADNILNSI
ncbi:MAG: hypothetical protein WC606_01355 [Candidatus Absconditabacterales bacterium]